jgi:starch-binding outer membrane protein, SusD/RagB family
MKKYIIKSFSILALGFFVMSCREDFLEKAPLDQITEDNFYKNAEQINATTAALYGFPWFNYNDKALSAIGDVQGGNVFTWDGGYSTFMNFSIQASNPRLGEAWGSLFKVVAMSNNVINKIPVKADASVSKDVIRNAVGEARFMRALAYFFLVRAWGPVPIIEDSEVLATGDANIPLNRVEDVYKFILNDLTYAENNCMALRSAEGRVSKWTAKALMAKVYLYNKDYANARKKAEEVIVSGQYQLVPDYAEIFKTKNDNNEESIFAWQWIACPDCWGMQNTAQAYLAPYGQGIVETGDGWGSFVPSIDLQRAFEPGDKRRKATMMFPGDVYPELKSKTNPNGYTYPKNQLVGSGRSHFRKYIVGAPVANGGTDGEVYFMRTGINTNILRYSDVLLIATEAILAGAANTSDATALKYFNQVRSRAGVPLKTGINFDDILKERRTEFAGEGDYWFDLTRIDRAKATEMIAKQERGFFYGLKDNEFVSQSFNVVSFTLPIPQSETDRNPKLKEAPQPYTFK